MAHLKAYDSFQTKKSKEKKLLSKEKSIKKRNLEDTNFIIDRDDNYGIVIEVKYHEAYVLMNGEIVVATLRKDINQACNQAIFPGDKVVLEKNGDNYIITHLIKRTSFLTRTKKDRSRRDDMGLIKCIAANVDLAVIVVSSQTPPLHPKFIDRYLMVLQNSDISSVICLNKCDLKTNEEDKILKIYKDLGIKVIETSTYQNVGLDELKDILLNKQAIFVGNSGVGKSSLTNAIMNDNEIKTSSVSDKSNRGRHTTTTSKYYVWDDNSSIIDTPGIRSLDVSSFKAFEIQEYFQELEQWKDRCRYNDCLHYHEPYNTCVVKQAVVSGFINQKRYESYLRIMSDILEDSYDEILKEISIQEGMKY